MGMDGHRRRVAQSDWPQDCVIEPPIFSEK